MNQPMDELQKNTGQKKGSTLSVRKRRAVISVIIAALLLLTIPVLAWFYRQRSMETMTQIMQTTHIILIHQTAVTLVLTELWVEIIISHMETPCL